MCTLFIDRIHKSGIFVHFCIFQVLSAALGYALPNLISRSLTHYGACMLFGVFGARLLFDVVTSENGAEDSTKEEMEEV